MLSWMRETALRRLLLLGLCLLGAFSIHYFAKFDPLLRLNTESLFRGAAGGVVVFTVSALCSLLLHLTLGERYVDASDSDSPPPPKIDPYKSAGQVIVGAAGEELFFRGYLFGWLLRVSSIAAFSLNLVLAFFLNLRSPAAGPVALRRAIEGTFYALLFYYNRSALVVTAARGVSEVLSQLIPERRFIAPVHAKLKVMIKKLGFRKSAIASEAKSRI